MRFARWTASVGVMLAGGIAVAPLSAHAQQSGPASSAVATLTDAYNASGQQLFASFATTTGNIVFSPYSIGTAMAMALAGARGDTATQMAAVLKQRLAAADIDVANGELLTALNAYDRSADPWTCPGTMKLVGHSCESEPMGDRKLCFGAMRLVGDNCVGNATPPRSARLLAANALMLTARGDLISDAYADLLKSRYAAEAFKNARLDDVNGWVARKTEGKIAKILDQLDPNGAAVLLNAVYFKARWQAVFDKTRTRDEAFNLTRSQKVQVPMMARTGDYALAARQGYRAVRLPYEIPELGLVVALPDEKENLAAVAARIDANELTQLFAALRAAPAHRQVALALPRFKAEYKSDLVAPFRQAGMKKAFDRYSADFSGMTGRRVGDDRLYIGGIIHRAVIEVAEESTEAAAATAIAIVAKAAMPRPQAPEPFRVDRPFLFYLVDDASGAILFEGRITDPR